MSHYTGMHRHDVEVQRKIHEIHIITNGMYKFYIPPNELYITVCKLPAISTTIPESGPDISTTRLRKHAFILEDFLKTPVSILLKEIEHIFTPPEPKEYEFVGSFKQCGVSLSHIIRKNPCLSSLKQVLAYMEKHDIKPNTTIMDIKKFMKIPVVQTNLNWLVSNNVIKEVEYLKAPWTDEKLPKDRQGDYYPKDEKQWISAKANALVDELMKGTGRSREGIAIHLKKYCL